MTATQNTTQPTPPLGLYVHIPWCIRKCPYCDFNSHTLQDTLPESDYIQALMSDLDQDLQLIHNRPLHSIFIGGGTPSLFSPEAIEQLITRIHQRLDFNDDIEITLEANPGTLERNKFIEFKAAGINRLSIGIQSFHNQQLEILGRIHNSGEAINAAEIAHEAGLENFNLDLMFGLPGQTQKTALQDVMTAVKLNPKHISYYQLTIEPHTAFYNQRPKLPLDEKVWRIQCEGQNSLRDHGYHQYEISAYAQSGSQCRHNLNYWKFGDYLGVGAGAHGKITDPNTNRIHRLWKTKQPNKYLKSAATKARIGNQHNISKEDLPLEFLMNALRLNHGFKETLFEQRTGLPLSILEPNLSACIDLGLLERTPGRIRCSGLGRSFLDSILERFIPEPA